MSATLKAMFNLPEFLTKRDAWAEPFHTYLPLLSTPRTDCPIELERPGTPEAQERWKNHRFVSADGIKEGMRNDSMSTHPLSDLQLDIISVAQGLDGLDTQLGWIGVAEEQILKTEHEGALFVQRQITNFLEKQRLLRDQVKKRV